jgi:hypothetical protein
MPIVPDEVTQYYYMQAMEMIQQRDVLIVELTEAVRVLVHEQCYPYCKDEGKKCTPDCWVSKYRKLLDKVKGGEAS